MSTTIKDHSAVLVRVLSTLDGFRAKHESWPESLEMDAHALAALMTIHLTPLGLFQLQSKMKLVVGVEGDVVARDRRNRIFSYSGELDPDAPARALRWLDFDLPEDSEA